MNSFEELNLPNALLNSLTDLGIKKPTDIQTQAYPVILSGKDMVGISQTGTGKTFAYMLPLLRELKFSKQIHPRILILVPTRELVIQVVENIELLAKYMTVRVLGVYGDSNIGVQKMAILEGIDILVATPGRLYDLALSRSIQFKGVNKLVIDEVDEMLDLGFLFQLNNIFELLPEKRQNIMFSATMTEDVEVLIDDFFVEPQKVSVALSGTPLTNIIQTSYEAKNFNTKTNLLVHLLKDKEVYSKVLVFLSTKKLADRLLDGLPNSLQSEAIVVHSNKSQNTRLRSIEDFDTGIKRILIATDLVARGVDLEQVSHVISFDTPDFPENYLHRIGRTGRAENKGESILFFRPEEEEAKKAIEVLMNMEIQLLNFPEEVTISDQRIPEEYEKQKVLKNHNRNLKEEDRGPGYHEKIDKNKKENLGGSYRRDLAEKYKKPKTRGDKRVNNKKKK